MGGKEQRRAERISTAALSEAMPVVLPVFYQLLSAEGAPLDPEIRAAFTEDVSASGLRLQIRHLPAPLRERLQQSPPDLRMQLDMPLSHTRIRIETRVAWCRAGDGQSSDAVFAGVEFVSLSREHGAEILAVARRAARRPKIRRMVLLSLSGAMLVLALALWWNHERHLAEERAMSARLSDTAARYDALSASAGEQQQRYNSTAATLEQQTDELKQLAVTLRALGGGGISPDAERPDAVVQEVQRGLAAVRRTISRLEDEILPDGTCVQTDRCGASKCCTWRQGVCLCDACCAQER